MTHASFEARIRRIEAHRRDPGHIPGAVTPGVHEPPAMRRRNDVRTAHQEIFLALRRGLLAALWGAGTLLLALGLGPLETTLDTIPQLLPWRNVIIAGLLVFVVVSATAILALSLQSLIAPGKDPRLRQMMFGALTGIALTLALPLVLPAIQPAIQRLTPRAPSALDAVTPATTVQQDTPRGAALRTTLELD